MLATFRMSGADKIEGAFGKKLGDVFDPASAIGTLGSWYRISSTNGFRSFTRYYVMITPTTKRIYCITASGIAENPSSVMKEKALIMEILEQKYGPRVVRTKKDELIDPHGDANWIRQGARSIHLKTSGVAGTFVIYYSDNDLANVADQEMHAEEAGKVNKSGL